MITGFQLRAAKGVLGLTATDIAKPIGLHSGTIARLCDAKNMDYLPCSVKNLVLIKKYFQQKNILFSDENSISLKRDQKSVITLDGMTRFQLKAARVATGLTQEELSFYIKISSSTLSILENLDNEELIESQKVNIAILKKFFERLGIIFPNDFTVTLEKDPQILAK